MHVKGMLLVTATDAHIWNRKFIELHVLRFSPALVRDSSWHPLGTPDLVHAMLTSQHFICAWNGWTSQCLEVWAYVWLQRHLRDSTTAAVLLSASKLVGWGMPRGSRTSLCIYCCLESQNISDWPRTSTDGICLMPRDGLLVSLQTLLSGWELIFSKAYYLPSRSFLIPFSQRQRFNGGGIAANKRGQVGMDLHHVLSLKNV